MTTAAPPAWAQSLLTLVTSARDRDGVLGDLHEEYSDTVLPERGEAAANRWYQRQMWGFVWRASRGAGAALGGYLFARVLLDMVAPAATPAGRATMTASLALALYALLGFRAGRRSGRAASGAVVAVGATLVAVMAVMVLGLMIAGIAGPWLRTHRAAWAGLIEGFDQPVVPMLLLGGTIASLGAALGKRYTGASGSPSSIRA
jgi:hypothetical protein